MQLGNLSHHSFGWLQLLPMSGWLVWFFIFLFFFVAFVACFLSLLNCACFHLLHSGSCIRLYIASDLLLGLSHWIMNIFFILWWNMVQKSIIPEEQQHNFFLGLLNYIWNVRIFCWSWLYQEKTNLVFRQHLLFLKFTAF